MKILMMTNTYAPMVGGIEESIRSFRLEFEKLGHEVFIVAPEAEVTHVKVSRTDLDKISSDHLPLMIKTYM